MNCIDTASLTCDLSGDDLIDLALECHGNTEQTVEALIDGVLARYGHVLDDAASAALNAVSAFHVPHLQDALDSLEATHRAN